MKLWEPGDRSGRSPAAGPQHPWPARHCCDTPLRTGPPRVAAGRLVYFLRNVGFRQVSGVPRTALAGYLLGPDPGAVFTHWGRLHAPWK